MFSKVFNNFSKAVYKEGVKLDDIDVAKMNEIKALETVYEKRKKDFFTSLSHKYKIKGENYFTIEPRENSFCLKAVKSVNKSNELLQDLQAEDEKTTGGDNGEQTD